MFKVASSHGRLTFHMLRMAGLGEVEDERQRSFTRCLNYLERTWGVTLSAEAQKDLYGAFCLGYSDAEIEHDRVYPETHS